MYNKNCDNLYVHPCFMKAGKKNYVVHIPETNYYSTHTSICDFRTEDPPRGKLLLLLTFLSSAETFEAKKLPASVPKEEQRLQPMERGHT